MNANPSSVAAPVASSEQSEQRTEEQQAAAKAMGTTMRKQRLQDFLFHKITLLFALSVLLVLAGIIVSLIIGAWPALKEFGPAFITTVEWDPVNDQYGALIAIVGTVATSLIALLIAFPISFGIALFLTEICPTPLRRPLGTAVELLAGVPSIIYGMWGLFIFAPLFGDHIQPILKKTLGQLPVIGQLFTGPMMGIGILTAGLILAVMIIPFIASVMRDVFEIVPAVLKESAYGLGCTKWEVVRKVVLPYTKTGVVGGVMLGLGRALGETMAVTFVIGNAHKLSWSLFAPGNSIASTLANEFAEAESKLHVSSLFALGLILFVITFIVLTAAKLMLMGLSRREGAK
jgi:phosphate transport system permease protein